MERLWTKYIMLFMLLYTGRDGSYYEDDLVNYWDGEQPRDADVADAWYSFDYAYGISPPDGISGYVDNAGIYKWHPHAVANAKHTASWFAEKTGSHGEFEEIEDIFQAIAEYYVGGSSDVIYNETLSEVEMKFIESAMERYLYDIYSFLYMVKSFLAFIDI